jgi:imidazolonepropionase-like amidohydrolase
MTFYETLLSVEEGLFKANRVNKSSMPTCAQEGAFRPPGPPPGAEGTYRNHRAAETMPVIRHNVGGPESFGRTSAGFGTIWLRGTLAGVITAVLFCVATGLAGDAPPFVVRDVSIFDGTRVGRGQDVLVQGGLITAVGRHLDVPAGITRVEGSGRTLLPGLIDAHVHVLTADHLRTALTFGVTTELDMFTSAALASAIKAEQAAGGGLDRADLWSAGTLVTAPGGHGTEYGLPIPTLSSAGEAQAFVDARIAEGSDYIKAVLDDGRAFGFSRPALAPSTLCAVVAAAHARRRLAIVHIATSSDFRVAVECGADGIAHVPAGALDPQLARLAASRHVSVTPTLGVGSAHERAPGGARQAVRELLTAGVVLLAGTDAPNPPSEHGSGLLREVELLVEAGLTPSQSLAAATSAPARAFGLADRGRLAVGLRADLVLVDGDPASDIRATRRTVAVWKRGVKLEQTGGR